MADTITLKVPEARGAYETMTKQLKIVMEANENIRARVTAVRSSWDSTSGDAFLATYNQIDTILRNMAETVNKGVAALNEDIEDYVATETANSAAIQNTLGEFTPVV